MNELAGKHIVLGLSGGIACYKAAELCRALVKQGATVQVVMTEAAEHFITAVTLQALSGRPVFTSQWDSRSAGGVGLGLQLWIPGAVLWIVGHSLAVWGARADPQFMAVFARHLKHKPLLDV